MRKATMLVMVMALLTLMCAAAHASGGGFRDARVLGMGLTRVGLPGSSTTFSDNPGALPTVQTWGLSLSPWPARVSGTATVDSESDGDRYGIAGSARNAAATRGFGAGWATFDGTYIDEDLFGIGYGCVCCCGIMGGVSLYHRTWETSDQMSTEQNGSGDNTWFDVGFFHQFDLPLNTWSVGVVARDVTDEFGSGPTWDLGVSVELPTALLIGADLVDVTDETNSVLNVGAEWPIPLSPVVVRAGLADGDFTAGAGYRIGNWEIGAAWADFEFGDEAVVGATGCF